MNVPYSLITEHLSTFLNYFFSIFLVNVFLLFLSSKEKHSFFPFHAKLKVLFPDFENDCSQNSTLVTKLDRKTINNTEIHLIGA